MACDSLHQGCVDGCCAAKYNCCINKPHYHNITHLNQVVPPNAQDAHVRVIRRHPAFLRRRQIHTPLLPYAAYRPCTCCRRCTVCRRGGRVLGIYEGGGRRTCGKRWSKAGGVCEGMESGDLSGRHLTLVNLQHICMLRITGSARCLMY